MSTPTPAGYFLWELGKPEAPALVGELRKLGNGDVSLQYAASWLESGYPLSPDMPLIDREYTPLHRRMRNKAAPGAVDDARPDSWGEKVIRYLHQPRGNHLMDYLYFTGDDRFGALGVSSSATSYQPFPTPALPRLEDAPQLSRIASTIASDGTLSEQQKSMAAANASLGGAKPKAVIRMEGEEWMLKFFNGEPYDLPLIEHASMTLAEQCGITVAKTMPVRLEGEHAIAIRRFDRIDGQRIHCISAATLIRAETPEGSTPIYGYPQLARALRRMGEHASLNAQLLDLFRRMVFNLLIANTDDHEKNHAFLVRRNALQLSPAYDVVTSGNGAVVHELLISEDSSEPLLANAMQVCAQFQLTPPEARREIRQIIKTVERWKAHFQASGVSAKDIKALAEFIDSDALLHERNNFGKTKLPAPSAKRKGPFSV